MCALGYEAEIKTIQFYTKSSSSVHIIYGNTKDTMSNACIETKIFA